MKAVSLVASASRNAGGLYEGVRRLHQVLAEIPGVEVTVLSLWDSLIDQDLASWQPMNVRVFKTTGPGQFGYAPALKPELLKTPADIIHTHGLWMYPSVAALAWHRTYRRPYIISPHGMLDPWALRNSGWKKRIATWLYEGEHLRNAACLRALCESEAQSIRALGLRNPICIVPNGVDLPTSDQSSKFEVRSSAFYSFAQGRKVLLYVGRIHPKKGLVNLLMAWKSVVSGQRAADNEQQEWVLAIAGWDQGGHEKQLRMLSAEYGMENSVVFLGPQFGEAKAACYANCDAFILPSFSEGLPMVILEAWAYGKPVLMTPECNVPEGFTNQAAIRIETEARSIAEGLRGLFGLSDTERTAMGDQGRKLVSERFNWQTIAQNMWLVYNWLLGGGSKPSAVL